MLFEFSEKLREARGSAYDLPMTNCDEFDAVLLDQGSHVVLNPANVVFLAPHLGAHDFGVSGRVTNLEYGYVRLSPWGGSSSLSNLGDHVVARI